MKALLASLVTFSGLLFTSASLAETIYCSSEEGQLVVDYKGKQKYQFNFGAPEGSKFESFISELQSVSNKDRKVTLTLQNGFEVTFIGGKRTGITTPNQYHLAKVQIKRVGSEDADAITLKNCVRNGGKLLEARACTWTETFAVRQMELQAGPGLALDSDCGPGSDRSHLENAYLIPETR